MIKTSVFQIQIICPGCNNFHAVSGISSTDVCRNCGRHINASAVIYDKMFPLMDKVKYMNGFLSGNIEQIGSQGYKLVYSSAQPYCEECKTVLDEDFLADAVKNKKPVSCPSCNHKMPVREADAEIKELHPKAIGVINDSFGSDYAEKNTDKESMLVFKCNTCGAGLELTNKTQRTIKCNYCDNENYLPDAIWTKLHPNKEVQPLFVLLEINESDIKETVDYFIRVTALRIFAKHFENFIREYFEKPLVNDAVLSWFKFLLRAENEKQVGFNMDISKIQKYFYENISLGLSSHPSELKKITAEFGRNLPLNLQQGLSSDKDENVRLALAKNQSLEKDIIKKLQKDSNPAVAEQAKKQKTGIFGKLFG